MYTMYLAGTISSNPETYEWRKRVREFFAYSPDYNQHITIIDPCQSRWNKELLTHAQGKDETFKGLVFDQNARTLLPHKDRQHVKQSTVAFVNMNPGSPEKPSIGTIFELAWYFDDPSKMVIGIHEDPENDFRCQHPFVQETVHAWVKDEIEACKLLIKFMDI